MVKIYYDLVKGGYLELEDIYSEEDRIAVEKMLEADKEEEE